MAVVLEYVRTPFSGWITGVMQVPIRDVTRVGLVVFHHRWKRA